MSREIQTFLGYDGIFYANKRRLELLDKKIDDLEIELTRLKKLRRRLSP